MTGCMDEYGMEYDCWALLYSAHCDAKDDLMAIVNVDKMWTIHPDQNEVVFWSSVPTAQEIEAELARRGIRIARTYVGEFATSMEMAGASITIMHTDEELNALMKVPVATPFFTQA